MSRRSDSNTYELQDRENEPLSRSYYAEDISYDGAKTTIRARKSWRTRFSGWRGGVVASIAVSALVLFINIILAIVAATQWHPTEGIATAFTGDCTLAAQWTTAVHLVINLLSSLLLGASNYCMQRLVAPTRNEVDNAHAQRKWLDIGIPSIRNLASISKRRLMPWIVLALSSIPLHFLYNSVVFETIGANYVYFLVVTQGFFTDKNGWHIGGMSPHWDNDITRLQNTLLAGKYLNRTVFENITDTECKSRYNAPFINNGPGFGVPVSGWQVGSHVAPNNSIQDYSEGIGQLGSGLNQTTWKFSYCLSKKSPPPSCSLQFSQTILYIVIVCNILKVGSMIFILRKLNQETIVTVGDAIKSFLQTPDATTKDCCLMSRRTVDRFWKVREVQLGQQFKQIRREHWAVACSKRRWRVSLFLYFGAITTTGTLIGILYTNDNGLSRNGFGKVNTDYIIDLDLPFDDTSIIPHILLANFPQAVMSFIYLAYNGQFTAMLAHLEWSNYAVKRAPLRVTIPSPGQRSTYFLQLPYRFSVLLLLAAVVLHWFISQSIFLVRIAAYKDGTRLGQNQEGTYFSGVGYSNSALIASLSWGSILLAAILAVAFFGKYPVGLPLGGMNSAVISAACHVKHEERGGEDVSGRPLKWGVTLPGGTETVGHCSFSSGEVDLPEVGHLYA